MSKQPFIQLTAFQGAEFNINGETKSYSIMELFKLKDFLKGHLKYCSHIWRDLNYYKDYDEVKVDQYLGEQEEGMKLAQERHIIDSVLEDEVLEYSIGDNFAKFLNVSSSSEKPADNHQASNILKKEYTEKFGPNTLTFDAEKSHCYVYTKDKEEAKQFLLFVYEKYIKSFLEPWYEGWDDFVVEFNNASEEEKQMFDHLSW